MKTTINIDGKKIAEQILGGNAAGEEKGYLLYVELPNLINRIMKLAVGQTPDEGMARIFAEEIKKVSNAELKSALNTVKMLSANLVSDKKNEDKCPSFTPEDSTGRKHIGPSMKCPY